jgi:hypothetical protein
MRRGGGANAAGVDGTAFPRDRVSIMYRSLLDAAILSSQMATTTTGGDGSSSRQKRTANQTGFIKKTCKFNADDVLLPYKVFLRIDSRGLEYLDGGYGALPSWENDWKTKPRYGFHLAASSSGGGTCYQNGTFSAMHYDPHTFTDDDRGTRLSSKEILACVNYIIACLNDDDCCDFAETELLQWMAHICSRPDYVACIPVQCEVSYILHEISTRLNCAFDESGGGEKKYETRCLLSPLSQGNGGSRRNKSPLKQESLVAAAKCLSALICNCTTRLGIGMHLYIRPVVEMVATWAESAWNLQSGGGTDYSATQSCKLGGDAPSNHRRKMRTEADIFSLLPYLYSSVTHLLAAHPEQSMAVLSSHGHSLLRLARRNYLKVTTNQQSRDALTEYFSAHLLVAETSGKLCGLPEGDLGPLVEEVDAKDDDDANGGKQRKKTGATLDGKWIGDLLEMVRNEKIWESLFSTASGHDGSKKKKTMGRKSLSGKSRGGGGVALSVDGGETWTPLNRRQRRHLELVSRLLRAAQRLHLADADENPLDSMADEAEKIMSRSGIEGREIDIEPDENYVSASIGEAEQEKTRQAEAMASSPWVRMVCQHLYQLNPKLAKTASTSKSSSFTQSTIGMTTTQGTSTQQLTQRQTDGVRRDGGGVDASLYEQTLLQTCPALQALLVPEEDIPEMTLLTHNSSNTLREKPKTDSVRPTITATLQLICSCAEAFPRGECWSSSNRRNWSAILDDTPYPGGTSARVRERNGSSPADAAAIVYLLGTTLESCGGSGGDDTVQLWTVMALLKMVESSAIICSREGVAGANFTSSELPALRVAWKYVWKVLFRYDLRYASYTSGAHGNNVGELVLQLLTQIIRYQCTDRKSMLLRGMQPSPFVHEEQTQIWKLPVFEDPSSILSAASFELITTVIQFTDISGSDGASLVIGDTFFKKDQRGLLLFCLKFVEVAMDGTPRSLVQRAFLPFVATCLSALISNGAITPSASTYEMDNLTRFGTTEDVEPIPICDPDSVDFDTQCQSRQIHHALWVKSIFPFVQVDEGLGRRVIQGRGALLNTFSDAEYERSRLTKHLSGCFSSNVDSNTYSQQQSLGDIALEKIKTVFDEMLFQLQYGGGSNGGDGNGEGSPENDEKTTVNLPQITCCLSLLLSVIVSKHSTSLDDAAGNIEIIASNTFTPIFDQLSLILSSLVLDPADVLAVMNHVDGMFRVFTFIASAGGGGSSIPELFGDHAKSMYSLCKKLLKEYRRASYTSTSLNATEASISEQRRRADYDSDDDGFAPDNQRQTQQTTQKSRFSDDSDGFMDDDDDDDGDFGTQGTRRPRKPAAPPPPKRRRIGHHATKTTGKASQMKKDETKSVDCPGALACASLMTLLNPSVESLETITDHLVWPEDLNNENGHDPVSKTLDPYDALACATMFCRKSVILRRDRLSPLVGTREDDYDDQQSAIILCIDMILQARRHSPPASKHFMCGLWQLSMLVKIGDYSDSRHPISVEESKMIVDALYPEGAGQGNDDYRMLRQWKKALKYRCVYRSEQLSASILTFLFAQKNLHEAFDNTFADYFVKVSKLLAALVALHQQCD